MGTAAALRAVGAAALVGARDRPRARQGGLGRTASSRTTRTSTTSRRSSSARSAWRPVHGAGRRVRGRSRARPSSRPSRSTRPAAPSSSTASTPRSSAASATAVHELDEAERDDVNEALIELFDGRARQRRQERLLDDPGDIEAKVDFIVALPHGHRGLARAHGPALRARTSCEKTGQAARLLEGYRRIFAGRAPARRVRHLVPQAEGQGPGDPAPHGAGEADGAHAARAGRPGAARRGGPDRPPSMLGYHELGDRTCSRTTR